MINRKLPFGYRIADGKIDIHPEEAAVVQRVFRQYQTGASLMEIAVSLTDQHVEYLPGMFRWNKNRVRRMLSDRRYLGERSYSEIIASEDFEAVQMILSEKNTQASYNRRIVISEAVTPIHCGACGASTRRINDKRFEFQQKHICTNAACGKEYRIKDEQMSAMIVKLLKNAVIQSPSGTVNSMELHRKENEIERLFETPNVEVDTIRQLIFDVAAEKYRLLTAGLELADKLRADLATVSLPSCNIRKTVMETVKKISLIDDETIEVELINGLVLREGNVDGANTAAEDRSRDPTQNTARAAEISA